MWPLPLNWIEIILECYVNCLLSNAGQIQTMKKKIAICTLSELQRKTCLGWYGIVGDIEQQCFLIYKDNEVYSYRNQCPHTGVNLEWIENQFLDGSNKFIQCATHGALFKISNGLCIHGPCLGEHLKPVENMQINNTIYLLFSENG